MLAILVGVPLQSASALEQARAPGAFLESAPFDVPARYFAPSSLLNPFEIMQSVRFAAPPDRYKTRVGWLIGSMQAHAPTLTSTGRVLDEQLQRIGVETIQSELAQVSGLPDEEYLTFMLNIAADASTLEMVNARRTLWDRVLSLGRNAAAAMASDFVGRVLSSFGITRDHVYTHLNPAVTGTAASAGTDYLGQLRSEDASPYAGVRALALASFAARHCGCLNPRITYGLDHAADQAGAALTLHPALTTYTYQTLLGRMMATAPTVPDWIGPLHRMMRQLVGQEAAFAKNGPPDEALCYLIYVAYDLELVQKEWLAEAHSITHIAFTTVTAAAMVPTGPLGPALLSTLMGTAEDWRNMSREEQALTTLTALRLLVYARLRQLVADGARCTCDEEEPETPGAEPATEDAPADHIAVTAVNVVAPPVLFRFSPDDWSYSVRPDSGVVEIEWRWPRAYNEILADPDALFFGEEGTRAIEGISFIVEEVDCPYLSLPDEGEWGNISAGGGLHAEFTRIEETGEASARIHVGCPIFSYEDFEAGGIRGLPYTYSARLRVKWWLYDISDWYPFSYTCTEGEPPPPPPPGEGIQLFPQ